MPFLIGGKMDLSKAYTFKKQDEIYGNDYGYHCNYNVETFEMEFEND